MELQMIEGKISKGQRSLFGKRTKGRKAGIVSGIKTLDRRRSEIRAAGSLGKRSKEEREGKSQPKKRPMEGNNGEVGEITFPPLQNIRESEEEQRAKIEEHQGEVKDILSCVNAKERIVVNDQYSEQTIAIGRQLPTKIKIRKSFQYRAQSKRAQKLRTSKAKEEKPGARKKRSDTHQSGGSYKGQHFARSQVSNVGLKPCHCEKGQRKLCVDFMDINKACPKEHHSLPVIEQKVEDLHRHRLKCFLDAYKGYHQIPIAERDEEKNSLLHERRVFCYRRLPFGLKNASATYQRLIDKVFNHQLGRNMKVNADNIVIKSNANEEMLADIKETLNGL
ncbi:reverse transcriptase domain-containing protein [Tanacetum coccineum]